MTPEAGHKEGAAAKATLYVLATPIGNLRDITLRALDVLGSVDVIAAEDTRVTARLLQHYSVSARVIAVHEHNERRGAQRVISLLQEGRAVAFVCDAGTPGVSDPGAGLVRAVRGAGFAVVPIPGPSALTAALSVSGLECAHLLWYGFLPAQGAARKAALERLEQLPYALVFYEAPHRIVDSAQDLEHVLGPLRRVVIAREISKVFETVHECALGELSGWLQADVNRQRGEFVVMVDAPERQTDTDEVESRRLLGILLAELPLKQAVGLAARIGGGSRNRLYQLALTLKNSGASDNC